MPREALQITSILADNPFTTPPSIDDLIAFINELGYPTTVEFLSKVVTNNVYLPWWVVITIINMCLTGKTSGYERPRAPVIQILWE